MVAPPSKQKFGPVQSGYSPAMGLRSRLPADPASEVAAALKKKAPPPHQRTLDLEHMRIMQQFEAREAEMRSMREEVSRKRQEVDGLEAKGRANLDDAEFDRLMVFRDDIASLESQIATYADEANEVNYLVNTGDILFKYYDVVENGLSNGNEEGNKLYGGDLSASKSAAPAGAYKRTQGSHGSHAGGGANGGGSILRYFTNPGKIAATNDETGSEDRDGFDTTTATCPWPNARHGNPHVRHNHNGWSGDDRATLLDKYMSCIDSNYVKNGSCPALFEDTNRCPHCGSERRVVMLHDGCVYCSDCFTQEYILIDHEKPSYKDPPKEIIYYAYKRINHFNEWLNQIQGKETTEIPDDVYDRILLEIKKEKITNMAVLNKEKVKAILKKLRINKYYEHVAHIIFRLNGIPVPHMSPELEERLRQMFCQIQVPFLRYAPPERKNFLSYSYVLHKFMQLLEKDEYLPSFPLLKSREKLHQQDVIWQKICHDLGWAFYKSI